MGRVETEEGDFRRPINYEIKDIIGEDIIQTIKGLRWYGHIKMDNGEKYYRMVTR